jgi:branched-subunit amino acid permease
MLLILGESLKGNNSSVRIVYDIYDSMLKLPKYHIIFLCIFNMISLPLSFLVNKVGAFVTHILIMSVMNF